MNLISLNLEVMVQYSADAIPKSSEMAPAAFELRQLAVGIMWQMETFHS